MSVDSNTVIVIALLVHSMQKISFTNNCGTSINRL